LFLSGGLYTYFIGRVLPLAVALMAILAVVLRQAPLRRTAAGLGLAALVTVVLFAPMVPNVIDQWDDFNSRVNGVSVFRDEGLFERTPWERVRSNLGRNYRGFVMQDGSEMARGLWGRYGPAGRAPLEIVGTHLFWAGMVVGVIRWRKTYLWWPFAVPLFIGQLFSSGTPDLARAVFFAPFYFLFVGMFFEEILQWSASRLTARTVAVGVLVGLVAFVAVSDARE
jgi:hypothetical protein